jgi:hypothetical protein
MKSEMHYLRDAKVDLNEDEEEYDKMQQQAKSAPRRPLSPYIFFS